MSDQPTQSPLKDPRSRPDFNPQLYPRVNGQDASEPLDETPHPGSDTRHIDPGQCGGNFRPDFKKLMAEFRRLKTDAKTDGEPHTKPKEPKAGVSGYGRSIKWAYVVPLIFKGRVKGAKVIAKWNPHISSSGIPIPHS